MTCYWSKGGSNWKIGDFNYLVVFVNPDVDTSLYVQLWAEPHERVWIEIGSGETCPGAIRYIGSAQRTALEARGYARGGRAGNFEKEVVIDSAAAAEAAALEVLQIFFEVFTYRGQWRLSIERHRGERAGHKPVYTSVTPDDFAKVAAHVGYEATVTKSGDARFVALTRGRRKFLAVMEWRVAKQNLYSLVALQADLTLPQPVPDEAISAGQLEIQVRESLAHRRAHGAHQHAAGAGWWRIGGVARAVAGSLDEQLARLRATAPACRRAIEASQDITARRAHSLSDGRDYEADAR